MFWYTLVGISLYVIGFLSSTTDSVMMAICVPAIAFQLWILRGMAHLGVRGTVELTTDACVDAWRIPHLDKGWLEVWCHELAVALVMLTWIFGCVTPVSGVGMLLFTFSMFMHMMCWWDSSRLMPGILDRRPSRPR